MLSKGPVTDTRHINEVSAILPFADASHKSVVLQPLINVPFQQFRSDYAEGVNFHNQSTIHIPQTECYLPDDYSLLHQLTALPDAEMHNMQRVTSQEMPPIHDNMQTSAQQSHRDTQMSVNLHQQDTNQPGQTTRT